MIERLAHKVSFENNGTFTDVITVRVRVQSPAGVDDFGMVRLPYMSSVGEAQIASVRVMKPDGSTITTPLGDVQDLPEQVTVAAPLYSDLKEKQVAVKGLGVGDVLEYENRFSARSPLVPGQFWFTYNFFSAGMALDDQLEISLPVERAVNVKSLKVQPIISEKNGRRIYTWKTAHVVQESEEEKAAKANADVSSPPDVQISSFRTWDEVAQWYWGLQQPRSAPVQASKTKRWNLRVEFRQTTTRFAFSTITYPRNFAT